MVFLKRMKIGQKMLLGFGMITIFILTVLAYTYTNFTKQSKAVELNLNTYNLIRESDAIIISLLNMETGARGFAVAGKEEFLEPFNEGKSDYQTHMDTIKRLAEGNSQYQSDLTELDSSIEAWVQWESSQIVEGRRKVISGEITIDDLAAVVRSGVGKAQMDNSRKILNNIINQEQILLEERKEDLNKMENRTKIVMVTGGLLSSLLTILISVLLIKMVVKPIKTVTNTFKEISEGEADLEVRLKIDSNDELGEMSTYFNTFMAKLKELMVERKNQSWLKNSETELNEEMRGEQDVLTLANKIITYIAKDLNVQIGAMYIRTTNDTFNLFGSYAYSKRKNLSNQVRIGEGIVGQAALEKQTIMISNVPEDYIKIVSGLGEATPKNMLVTPFVYENEVLGVIELGSFHEFTDIQLKFIEQVSSSIAITMHSAQARLKMKELLAKTIEQSEELQAQQEELRQNNEELETQTKALKESEASLQSQQEELRVINGELQERTKGLEKQKNAIAIKNESLKNAQVEIEEKAKALESASKYKSEFLANMSHELRTPLNSILVLSQILAGKKDNTPLSDKQLEFASTIHSSGEDLLRLINDILDLSKIEAGKMDVNFEEISLLQLSSYVERTFSVVADQKKLDFKIEIQDGVPYSIVSDLQRVQQILNNLISNAMKFTSKGGVTMTFHEVKEKVGLNLPGQASEYIGISITDTGIGIPIHKQSIIFEAFKQSDGTTSRKYGGTGLGLSISRELSTLLGGFIYLESNAGEGSTFTLILPYEKDEVKQGGSVKKTNTLQGAESTFITMEHTEINKEEAWARSKIVEGKIEDDSQDLNTNERTLLIIEDDKNFSGILSELAREKGYKSLIAQDGLTGIDIAIKHKPDAILLDIGLPDISGWRVIEKLKENKDTENISVHVISANDHYNAPEKMNSILGYLKKPASLESLELVFMKIQEKDLKPLKKILIVDENKDGFGSISESLSEKGFQISLLDNGADAYNVLTTQVFDCLILDLKLKDMSGFELLEKLWSSGVTNLQIIIHTENQLTQEDELELQKYTQSIIIKGTRSSERLVSEASLFLHNLDARIGEEKIKTIKLEHEKIDILSSKKILIVDDDMRNIFALTSVMEEKGSSVVVARNGNEGIKKLNENPDVDLILMDIMMPEMDGYTAISEIRKKEAHKKIPIIAITAKAMKDDKQKCIDVGANEYLTKPVDMDKLISLLRVWLYK